MIANLNTVRTIYDFKVKDVETTHKTLRVYTPYQANLADAVTLGNTLAEGLETLSKLKVDGISMTFVQENDTVSGVGNASVKGNLTFIHADGKSIEFPVYDPATAIADGSLNGVNEAHADVITFAQMLVTNQVSLQSNLSLISAMMTEQAI